MDEEKIARDEKEREKKEAQRRLEKEERKGRQARRKGSQVETRSGREACQADKKKEDKMRTMEELRQSTSFKCEKQAEYEEERKDKDRKFKLVEKQ